MGTQRFGEQAGSYPVSVQHDEVEVVTRGAKGWGQVRAKRRASCRKKHPHIREGQRGDPSQPCAQHPPPPSGGGGGRMRGSGDVCCLPTVKDARCVGSSNLRRRRALLTAAPQTLELQSMLPPTFGTLVPT